MSTKNVNEVPSECFIDQYLKNSLRKKLAKLIIQEILIVCRLIDNGNPFQNLAN